MSSDCKLWAARRPLGGGLADRPAVLGVAVGECAKVLEAALVEERTSPLPRSAPTEVAEIFNRCGSVRHCGPRGGQDGGSSNASAIIGALAVR
jgi:hypothetical protein